MTKHLIAATLEELYRYFDIINKKFYEGNLPEPIILIGKGKKNTLGTCSTKKSWTPCNVEKEEKEDLYEISISANHLNRPVEEIVGTLAHEIVHYNNLITNVRGAKSRKHNELFKNEAERIGLECTEEEGIGWGNTQNGPEFNKFIKEEIKPNEAAFIYFKISPKESEKKEKKVKKGTVYRCSCGEKVKGREGLNIICAQCKQPFEKEE